MRKIGVITHAGECDFGLILTIKKLFLFFNNLEEVKI